MQSPVTLEEKVRSHEAVCELMKHRNVPLPGTQSYLAQLREVLQKEIAELKFEEDKSRVA